MMLWSIYPAEPVPVSPKDRLESFFNLLDGFLHLFRRACSKPRTLPVRILRTIHE